VTVEVFGRSPLADRGDDLARVGAREVPFLTQLSVRSRTPEALGLPTEPNTWRALDGVPREALWLGPDEWLVVAPPGSRTTVPRTPLDDRGAEGLGAADSVVDVSANRTVIELGSGDDREPRALLEQACGLDVHPRSWRAGMCAQTLFARVPVILQQREVGTRLFVRPSFAGWLVDLLLGLPSGT